MLVNKDCDNDRTDNAAIFELVLGGAGRLMMP